MVREAIKKLGYEAFKGTHGQVEATVWFNYCGDRYRAVIVADVPYHVTEAIMRDSDDFPRMCNRDWVNFDLECIKPAAKVYAWAEVLELENKTLQNNQGLPTVVNKTTEN